MIYVDEYNIVNTDYIVHAFLLDPCDEHGHEKKEWNIGLTLHIGTKAVRCAMTYPTEGYRNAAFEKICDLVRPGAHVGDEDEDL